MKVHHQEKNDPWPCSILSIRKVNEIIFKSNINVAEEKNNEDKYENVTNLKKKPVFVLKDCSVVLKDIWDDLPLIKLISLKYVVANNKSKCLTNKKNVQLMKAKALKDGKRLRVCLVKIAQHDENSNIVSGYMVDEFRNLQKDKFMENQRNEYHLTANVKEVLVPNNDDVGNRQVNLEEKYLDFQTNQLLNNNDKKYKNKEELHTRSEDLCKVKNSEQMLKIVSEIHLGNNGDNDVFDEGAATQIVPTQLENDTKFLTSLKQAQAESSRDISKLNYDIVQKIEPVVTVNHKQPTEDKCSFSDLVNFDDERSIHDMSDSDCISLFADSTMIEECDTEEPFDVSNDMVENYYKSLKADFNKMYEENVNDNETVVPSKICVSSRRIQHHQNSISMERPSVPSSTRTVKIRSRILIPSMNVGQILFYFRGHCYEFINNGYCNKYLCNFEHNFVPLMSNWYSRNESHLFKMLDELAAHGFTVFIKSFYSSLLYHFRRRYCNIDVNCVLKIFKKLYELTIITAESAFHTIECIQDFGHSIKSIIEKLGLIIGDNDFEFVNWMLKTLEKYIPQGEYWSTSKSLLLRIENLEPEIIEIVLKECINTQQNIDDIYINIINKLRNDIYSKINDKLLLSFKHLIKCNRNNVEGIMSSQKDPSIKTETVSSEYTRTSSTTDQAGEEHKSSDNDFTLHPIDDLPNPYSVHGRAQFSDFYKDLYNLQEGLKHDNYNQVMKILNSVKEDQKSLFNRACYQILSKEIKYSPYRLSKLILSSVQNGATAVFYQIISDVAKDILVDLAEKDLWMLAYILLKNVYIILEPQIYSYELDATTILLFAEIYLANEEAMKAFTLLKRTNIISTNPNKWKVQSIEKDSAIRKQIITILLYTTSEMFPEYAFFLFEFLLTDQSSNFHPIDLTDVANVMLPKFLLKKDQELIIKTTKLIMKYNFILKDVVCRALICTLFHFDMHLAKQLYKISAALGMYSTLQFHPITYLIINSDWTMEEMHLAMMDLLQQFLLNIGHAIDHVSSRRCAAYLVFEVSHNYKI
ncbi:uncharacterized protein LOC143429647 [Xylocopa sonorina]|uniref:uncharacterized protein LOC143429647 n=1 Tax=Xylocopa sonorina TaxID=1818115 RepID=UPI00403B090E